MEPSCAETWSNKSLGTQQKNSHRDTQHLKTKTHRDKWRERERERERDFAQSFPVTAGPPGPKYTATDTCTEGSFGRSPLCKGTCANKFGPVNTGPAKERALAWRSLSLAKAQSKSRFSREPGPQVASQGLSGRLFLSTAVFPWPTAKEAP